MVGGIPPGVVPEEPVVVALPPPGMLPVVVLATFVPLAPVADPAFGVPEEVVGAAPAANCALAAVRVATAVRTSCRAAVPGAAPSMIEEEVTCPCKVDARLALPGSADTSTITTGIPGHVACIRRAIDSLPLAVKLTSIALLSSDKFVPDKGFAVSERIPSAAL